LYLQLVLRRWLNHRRPSLHHHRWGPEGQIRHRSQQRLLIEREGKPKACSLSLSSYSCSFYFTSNFCCVYTENPLFSLSESNVPVLIQSISGEMQSIRFASIKSGGFRTTFCLCFRLMNEALCIDIVLSDWLTFSSNFIAFHGFVHREPNVPSGVYKCPTVYQTNDQFHQTVRGGGSRTDAECERTNLSRVSANLTFEIL
jgi:hypothetical protein